MAFFNSFIKHCSIIFCFSFYAKKTLSQDTITYQRVSPATIAASRYMIIQRNPHFMIIQDDHNAFYELTFNRATRDFTLLNSLFHSDNEEIISNDSDDERLYPNLYLYLIPKYTQTTPRNDFLSNEDPNHTKRGLKRSRSESDTESLAETIHVNDSQDSESLASTIIVLDTELEEYSDYESEYEEI